MKPKPIQIERVQTGVRIEKKILKVLKGVAEYNDLSIGQMLELVLMHSFEGRQAFSKKGIQVIEDLKRIYSLDFDVRDYESFLEEGK